MPDVLATAGEWVGKPAARQDGQNNTRDAEAPRVYVELNVERQNVVSRVSPNPATLSSSDRGLSAQSVDPAPMHSHSRLSQIEMHRRPDRPLSGSQVAATLEVALEVADEHAPSGVHHRPHLVPRAAFTNAVVDELYLGLGTRL